MSRLYDHYRLSSQIRGCFFDSLRSLQTIQRVLVGAAKDLVCRSVAIWKK